jgi:uncharacterized protein YdbL (DUF1318 family)
MKKARRMTPVMFISMLLTACVTINVYFPAAAAESAADILIRDVYGIEKDNEQAPVAPEPEKETSALEPRAIEPNSLEKLSADIALFVLNILISDAYAAQPDINVSTPGINKLKGLMTARHQSLVPHYNSGGVGMENNGLISIKDAKAIPLKERNNVKKLVADENRDRNLLYTEIAKGNGHPEWEKEIRSTFARRWVGNAPSGWWHKGGNGTWQQK